ncbi:MAG: PP2C family serine/threonine-protein phosphatase [Verrucomicrobiota bacterium]|nr:PP2C family serine/threonine-protein phosphatase [Verrucomicrobiota bacterium]
MKYKTFGLTHPGKMRTRNEDAYLLDDIRRIYAVADGLGGLPEGDLASSMAIQQLNELLSASTSREPDYLKVFNEISRAVWREGVRLQAEIGIGTTLTLLVLRERSCTVCHVGDCAVFLFRKDKWEQLTTDHTMAEELRAQHPGEQVIVPEHFSHTLTRCIGQPGELQVEIRKHTLKAGDRLLICSDGITKTISEEELYYISKVSSSPQELIEKCINLANDRGGPDNSTGIAIFAAE